jgi:preprotein translocase subunit Sec61beta
MSVRRQNIAMPTTMAGLPSFTSAESIGGIKVSPVHFLVGIVVIALIVKLLQVFYG